MRVAQVPEARADFELVERETPDPDPDEVRIEVEACGVCHSDAYVKEGTRPEVEYPRVPGHEIVGHVDAVGEDVTEWETGDRVGVGWHGGHCFTCDECRRGNFLQCENGEVTGIDFDGGYAEYTVAPHEALAAVPEELESTAAAPLLCAGVTTYNALRNSGARAGDLVAVLGVGGLGHLGIQYAHAAGFETVAISRGDEKREEALDLGADHFVDSENEDPAEALQKLGGARVVLSTAPASAAVESVVGGLGTHGELVVVGVPGDPVSVSVGQLVSGDAAIQGWASGHARDSQDTLEFSALRDVRPAIETFGLDEAADAYELMYEGDPRFRVVIEP